MSTSGCSSSMEHEPYSAKQGDVRIPTRCGAHAAPMRGRRYGCSQISPPPPRGSKYLLAGGVQIGEPLCSRRLRAAFPLAESPESESPRGFAVGASFLGDCSAHARRPARRFHRAPRLPRKMPVRPAPLPPTSNSNPGTPRTSDRSLATPPDRQPPAGATGSTTGTPR